MKMGIICHHIMRRMVRRERKRRCTCLLLLHIGILLAQTVAFLQFCKRHRIKLCPPKWKRKVESLCEEVCEGACGCQDANVSDTAGMSATTRPEEAEGIVTAEGKIGDVEQTVSKKRATTTRE